MCCHGPSASSTFTGVMNCSELLPVFRYQSRTICLCQHKGPQRLLGSTLIWSGCLPHIWNSPRFGLPITRPDCRSSKYHRDLLVGLARRKFCALYLYIAADWTVSVSTTRCIHNVRREVIPHMHQSVRNGHLTQSDD